MDEGRWRCIGHSARGSSHVRSDLPNQDAIEFFPESGRGLPLILAIADGHGSAKSFRSDIGSRIAVQTATRVLREFVREYGTEDPDRIGALARDLEEVG